MPDASDSPLPDWITTGEAAELTGYAPAYIRQLILKGKLKGIKRGWAWFLKRDEVIAYAEKMDDLGMAKHDPWRSGARQRKEEETADDDCAPSKD
jgi:excisionase family DNA binding protein